MIKLDSTIQNFLDMVNNLPRREIEEFDQGVYFLFNNNELIYIGKTTAGLSRVMSHKDKGFDSYSFLNLVDWSEREILDLETVLIALLNPPLNLQFLPKGLETMKQVINNLKTLEQ